MGAAFLPEKVVGEEDANAVGSNAAVGGLVDAVDVGQIAEKIDKIVN